MMTNFEIGKLADALIKRIGTSDELWTTKQVAEYLGLTENAIRTRCCRGTIPHHRKHGNLYFSKNEIIKYHLEDDE